VLFIEPTVDFLCTPHRSLTAPATTQSSSRICLYLVQHQLLILFKHSLNAFNSTSMAYLGAIENITPFEKLPTELSQKIFLEATELDLEEDPIWRDPYDVDPDRFEQMVERLIKAVTSLAVLLQANQQVRGMVIWVLRRRIDQIKRYLNFLGMRLRPVWKEGSSVKDLCRPELVRLPRYDVDYPTVRARYWQVYEPLFAGEAQTVQSVIGFRRYADRFPTSEPPSIGIHLVFIWRLYDAVVEELLIEHESVKVCNP
jgi:hypothetical protein